MPLLPKESGIWGNNSSTIISTLLYTGPTNGNHRLNSITCVVDLYAITNEIIFFFGYTCSLRVERCSSWRAIFSVSEAEPIFLVFRVVPANASFQSEMNDDHLNVSLNILRFHQILRPNESFHTFLLYSPVNLTPRY